MFETISSLSLFIILLILIKKIYNKIEKIKNKLINFKNDISYKIEDLELLLMKDQKDQKCKNNSCLDKSNISLPIITIVNCLEKDFDFINHLSINNINLCLNRYDIKNHIKDIIQYIISSDNHNINIVLIDYIYKRSLYNPMLRDYFNKSLIEQTILEKFYNYGVSISKNNNSSIIFKKIQYILKYCCGYNKK